jgi:exodeoxyribonuclease-3
VPFTIATWNVNSVRLRLDQVLRFVDEARPDALCLQEIKCRDEQFPAAALARAGYPHQAVYGLKGHHGVAVVSSHPFATAERHRFCGRDDGRCLTVSFGAGVLKGVALANFYVPAGGDVPDPAVNERFAHKLGFLDEFAAWSARFNTANARTVLVGDLNVAPLEHDVWSHKHLLDVVSHTPIEVEKLGNAVAAGGWIDVMRRVVPAEQKLYTWWSYRALDWRASNRGRRLDHIWVSPALDGSWTRMTVRDDVRDWDRPSDHVPVVTTFET